MTGSEGVDSKTFTSEHRQPPGVEPPLIATEIVYFLTLRFLVVLCSVSVRPYSTTAE